jgi:hypothetical protein
MIDVLLYDKPVLALAELPELVSLIANVLAFVFGAYTAVERDTKLLFGLSCPPQCA